MTYEQWNLIEAALERTEQRARKQLSKLIGAEDKPHWVPGQGDRIRHSLLKSIRFIGGTLTEVRVERAAAVRTITPHRTSKSTSKEST